MKKQGFTLIELMVVIVIMGILAAVAVPKLFAMIAKSKASEVPTAAGTWINLQDAFVSETNQLGDWGQVGYSAPGAKSTSAKYTSGEFEYTDAASGSNNGTSAGWNAKNLHKLDDCPAGTTGWVLTAALGANDGTMTVSLGASSGDVAKCRAITPSFDKLARATAQ